MECARSFFDPARRIAEGHEASVALMAAAVCATLLAFKVLMCLHSALPLLLLRHHVPRLSIASRLFDALVVGLDHHTNFSPLKGEYV
jgi:hypothetical protein